VAAESVLQASREHASHQSLGLRDDQRFAHFLIWVSLLIMKIPTPCSAIIVASEGELGSKRSGDQPGSFPQAS